MIKRLQYRVLIKQLKKHDKRFKIYTRRGKGSERVIFHPDIDGRSQFYPVKCHGEGTELGKGTIKAIIRRFNLPKGILD